MAALEIDELGISYSGKEPPDKPKKDNTKPPAVTREHAIIFKATPQVSAKTYAKAINNVIGKGNTFFISRIPKSRICAYVATTEMVDTLCTNGFDYEGELVSCERRKRPSEKITISNCPPEIPDKDIISRLSKYGKITSNVIYINVNPEDDPDLGKIYNFKRIIYMLLKTDIPRSINMRHDEESVVLFLEKGNKNCEGCGKWGHTVDRCHNKPKEDEVEIIKASENNNNEKPQESEEGINENFDKENINSSSTCANNGNKRSYAKVVDNSIDLSSENFPELGQMEKTTKKPKTQETKSPIKKSATDINRRSNKVDNQQTAGTSGQVQNKNIDGKADDSDDCYFSPANITSTPRKTRLSSILSMNIDGSDESAIESGDNDPAISQVQKCTSSPLSQERFLTYIEKIRKKKHQKKFTITKFTTDVHSVCKQLEEHVDKINDAKEIRRLEKILYNLRKPE